jgi:NAD-reducing hydrogenase small subunit
MPERPGDPAAADKVYPCHEVVKIDYHLPGLPAAGGHDLGGAGRAADGQAVDLPYELIKYD